MRQLPAFILVALLVGCASSQKAPVIQRTPEASKPAPTKTSPGENPATAKPHAAENLAAKSPAPETDWRPETYTVKKGDTLYSIGLEFGFDYKEIAQWNDIQPPSYVIRIGQKLKLKEAKSADDQGSQDTVATPLKTEPLPAVKPLSDQSSTAKAPPVQTASTKPTGEPPLVTEPKAIKEQYSEKAMAAAPPQPAAPAAVPAPAVTPSAKTAEPTKPEAAKPEPAERTGPTVEEGEVADWAWPAKGKVVAGFNDTASAKGVDIAGTQGQPVYAAAAGKVVYSGSGLRGYGKLVIIKHNKTYLSAYAHNSQILVKEGQEVTKGQKIAEMGSTDTDRVKLHFEIRKQGKPVDPTKYLPEG
jgi:lipoprotein NlpD